MKTASQSATAVLGQDAGLFRIGELSFLVPLTNEQKSLYSHEFCRFLSELVRRYQPARDLLLEQRKTYQDRIDTGCLPEFLPETADIREMNWRIKGIPKDLRNRRVEITGPVEEKLMINALNAPVNVFMADFEDSLSPTWDNIAAGQINMYKAVRRTLTFDSGKNSSTKAEKSYRLNENLAVLICRVRGIHLNEKHILFQGQPIPGCLLDFAHFFFHNHQALIEMGTGPYFYLPKLQSYREAAWWSEVFRWSEQQVAMEVGTIKATVLIETLPAVFQMDEILFALQDYIVALNCGRWDYIFSYIKTLRHHPDRILPVRQQVTMDKPFLNAYSRLLIRTCHRRGALAMGGMAAFIPDKDPQKLSQVSDKVRKDKQLEAYNGHDGTWIAHPGLAKVARQVFDKVLGQGENQLYCLRQGDEPITAEHLLQPCEGEKTEQGLRLNIRIALHYISAWLNGEGCVPIYGLMEDAATAEISRVSIWQWIHHQQCLDNGQQLTEKYFTDLLQQEKQMVATELERFPKRLTFLPQACDMLLKFSTRPDCADFLTLPAYESLS